MLAQRIWRAFLGSPSVPSSCPTRSITSLSPVPPFPLTRFRMCNDYTPPSRCFAVLVLFRFLRTLRKPLFCGGFPGSVVPRVTLYSCILTPWLHSEPPTAVVTLFVDIQIFDLSVRPILGIVDRYAFLSRDVHYIPQR